MKYIVNVPFQDKENDLKVRRKDEVIDVTKKRAKAITDVLGADALEEVTEVEEVKEVKEAEKDE